MVDDKLLEDAMPGYLLSRLLPRLTDRQLMILWYRLDELTLKEIAPLLGISPSRVSQELKKMRTQARRAWGV